MSNGFFAGCDFKISCPTEALANSPITEIRERGNLALVLQEKMVIELQRSDLLESWQETCALGRERLNHLVQQAGCKISAALDEEDSVDVTTLANDTAAFFLLALRQKGMQPTSCSLDVEINFDHAHPEKLHIVNHRQNH